MVPYWVAVPYGINFFFFFFFFFFSRCRALKPAGRPLPHCRGGNGPPSATRRLRGGGAVMDSKNNLLQYVMWTVLRAVPTLAPSTHFVFIYFLQLHFRGHFRVHFRTSTPTFICGRTATFLRPFSCTFSYIHAYIHLWTHSDVSILRLHSSTSLFYAFTHLWVYSGLYSARRL
jgi:hypothetical protein